MSSLQLPGLSTGIDTASLISQLMAIERRSLNTYQQRIELWEEKQDALSTLESKLSNLRSAVRALSDADELKAFSASTSDEDKLTASATANAFEGTHTVAVNQLAAAERWIHTSGIEYAEDTVGAGTFIYSYNHKETSITTTATTTLEELVGLINNDANNPGVTASLLYYNSAYHLVLNGNSAGTDYKISVNPSTTEDWKSSNTYTYNGENATLTTKIKDLVSGTLGDTDKITISGTDRNGVAIANVELSVTDNTRVEHLIGEINDAFDGRAKAVFENGTIILTDNVSGASDISVSLTYTGTHPTDPASLDLSMAVNTQGGTAGTLTDFAASDFTVTQTAQDSKVKVDGFPTSSAVAEIQTLTPAVTPNSGTYTLTYNGQTTAAIAHNAGTAAIQAALEALSNVSADDITVGGNASDGLKAGALTFTFRDTAGDVDMISIDPGNLDQSARSNYTWTETTKGQDGYISRSSNTVDDVIYGVTLHLHDTTDAGGEQIALTRDIQSVKDKLSSMIDAYNLTINFIQEKTGYNDVLKTAGVLMGDYIVSTVHSQIRAPIYSQTDGFIEDFDTFLTPGHIGLELDKDGLLSLDSTAFDEAIAEDYLGVLAVIGADKTGSSTSDTVEFYGASGDYTTAGTYNVEVVVSSGAITSAKIKLSTQSAYRDADYSGNIVTGNSTFDDNGNPNYPENALQLSVDLSQDGTFTATVRVKQGFTGAMEDALDKMLKVTSGSIDIDQEHIGDQIEYLQDKVDDEDYRLAKREARLIERFARMEKTLTLIQNQMVALGLGGI